MKTTNARLWVTAGGIAASVLVVTTFAYAKFVSGVPEGVRGVRGKAAATADQRGPAAVPGEFRGDVSVTTVTGPNARGKLFQIIDRTRNVVCYGQTGDQGTAISCADHD